MTRLITHKGCFVVVVAVYIVVAGVVGVIIVGTRNLTLKYGKS